MSSSTYLKLFLITVPLVIVADLCRGGLLIFLQLDPVRFVLYAVFLEIVFVYVLLLFVLKFSERIKAFLRMK